MDNETYIIGSLTPRKAIYLFLSFVFSYAGFKYLELPYAIAFFILVLIFNIKFWKTHERPKITPDYLGQKCRELGPEEFERWRQKMIANVAGRIYMRERKGIKNNAQFEQEKQILQNFKPL